MKYSNLNLGQIEAGVNRLGGEEGFNALLASSGIDVCKALALQAAINRFGWTDADITRFSEGDAAKLILPVVRGYGKVELMKLIIDLSAPPVLPKEWDPKDWEVLEHIPGPADFEWSPERIKPWLSDRQKGEKNVEGNKLLAEIRKRGPTYNANMLDWYLAHPELVPEDWNVMFFMDTVYRHRSSGCQYVRYLYRRGRGLDWDGHWLGNRWHSRNPSAAPAGF